MTRGTTPILTLTLSTAIEFDTLYITFQQGDITVFEKTIADVTVEGARISVPITQAETLLLDSKRDVKIQLRGKHGNYAYASEIVRVSVSDILKEGEI